MSEIREGLTTMAADVSLSIGNCLSQGSKPPGALSHTAHGYLQMGKNRWELYSSMSYFWWRIRRIVVLVHDALLLLRISSISHLRFCFPYMRPPVLSATFYPATYERAKWISTGLRAPTVQISARIPYRDQLFSWRPPPPMFCKDRTPPHPRFFTNVWYLAFQISLKMES